MLGEGTLLFGIIAGRGPGHVARNRLELFAQFAGNEKSSPLLGPIPAHKRPTAGESRKYGEFLRVLEAMQRTQFTTLLQVVRAGFAANINTPHNGRPLARKCLKGSTQPSALLSLCSWLFGARTASKC
jgi:hypothetical protein